MRTLLEQQIGRWKPATRLGLKGRETLLSYWRGCVQSTASQPSLWDGIKRDIRRTCTRI